MALPDSQSETGYAPQRRPWESNALIWLVTIAAVIAAGAVIARYLT